MSILISKDMRELRPQRRWRTLSMISVLWVCVYGCDSDDPDNDNSDAGEMSAGEMSAGETSAGEMSAGEASAGEISAGEISAGEMSAGEMSAGEMSAGEMSAGEMSAGEMSAGEMSAGEMSAGEMSAGEMSAGEMSAGEMSMTGEYSPETSMNTLSDDGQRAFCESFVARDQAATESTSASDQMTFKETSCLLAGLLGGATDEMGCETDRQQCLMDFENAMITVESCLEDFGDAFSSCGATVAEIEACEVATRELLLSSILSLPASLYSCGNVGEPGVFLLASGLPTAPPAECAIDSVAMCQ